MTREHLPFLLESERSSGPAPVECLGRMLPDVVVLPGGAADLGILQIVIEEETRLRHLLPIDSMIALVLLRHERRLDTSRLGREIQRDETAAWKGPGAVGGGWAGRGSRGQEGADLHAQPRGKPGSTRFSKSKWSFNW